MLSLSDKTDAEIDSWTANHERRGVTDTPLYRELLEERARRRPNVLNIEKLLNHLMARAREGRFTTYGDLATASTVPWNVARHAMNGTSGHLDRLLDVCHARNLPLLTAICVNQHGVATGELAPASLTGFVKGARRLGYVVTDELAFLRQCQRECFN